MLLAAAALQAAPPASASPPPDPQAAVVAAAAQAMATGHPDQAIAAVEPALAAYEKQYAGDRRQLFCGYSPAETLAEMLIAATARRDAVALSTGWCDALFIKGFSLSDLHRFDEAVPFLERAVAMAPLHAHFLNELGFAYQQQRNWQKSYDTFARAADATATSEPDRVTTEKTRAWRGMGYARVEQGRYDDAEKLYRQCLQLDPDDARAKNELQYVTEQRNRPRT